MADNTARRNEVRGALAEVRGALGALRWECDWRVAVNPPANPAGARPDSDDWPTWREWFQGGDRWRAGENWLYARITVPAEAEGVRIDGTPAAMHLIGWHPFSLYVDGKLLVQEERPWLATGPALLPLTEPLRAGHTYQLALRVPIAPYGITFPFGASLRVEAVALAQEDLEAMEAQFGVAETLAESDADRAAIAAAYAAIDIDAIKARDWDRMRASFTAAEAHLLPLSERAKAHTVELMGHAHIDMNWLWTWDDTVAVVLRDFHSVAELMRDYPELTFTHSQVPTYQIVQERDPQLWNEIRRRIDEGRWEVVATTWVEGDLNMANGESLARQFLYAIRWCRENLGVTPKVMWEPDTFGHPGNIPQLARLAGIERYFHMRCNPALPGRWPVYWWEGIDGSRVLVTSRPYNGDITPNAIANAFRGARGVGSRVGFHIHGVGDHGGGPTRANLDAMRRLSQRPLLPSLRGGSMEAFGTTLLQEGVNLPVARGESSTVFEGCYTSHADIKRFNREGENRLLTAEALAALAGTDDRAAMAAAWKHVLFNQFHDLLDGSAIHESYAECAEKHAMVVSTADKATDSALTALAAQVDTRGEGPAIFVANPLAWARTDVVRVSGLTAIPEYPELVAPDGSRVPGQRSGDDLLFTAREVPALGHAVYHLVAGAERPDGAAIAAALPVGPPPGSYSDAPTPPAPADALCAREEGDYFRVETPHFRVMVSKASGILASLFDKRCDRQLVAYGLSKWGSTPGTARPELAMNVLQLLDEAPHGMSSWLLANVRSEQNLIAGATTTLVENGPVRVLLRVEHAVRDSRITQEISFYRDLDRIDFDTVIDWQEVGTGETGVPTLKVGFTARLNRPEASYEIPYGAVARPADGQEVPALRWADVSADDYGFSLLNDCKYGYDALGSRLRLTLVRSSYNPDPVSDRGEHRLRYSLVPHPGTWREADTVRRGAGFNQPLLARAVANTAGSQPAAASGLNLTGLGTVVVSSVKCPEDGEGVIVRLYESQGQSGEVTLALSRPVSEAQVVNLLEETLEAGAVRDGVVALTFRPWEVKTLRLR